MLWDLWKGFVEFPEIGKGLDRPEAFIRMF